MFRAVVLFSAVLALAKGQITQVSQCTGINSGPLPLLTVVEGCSIPPCALPQGSDAVVSIVFQAPYAIQKMRTAAFFFITVIPIQFDLGEYSETCNFLSNTFCPVEQGELIVHTLRVPIMDYMPVGTMLPVEFRVLDDNNVAVTCTRVAVRIMPPVFNKLEARTATMSVEV